MEKSNISVFPPRKTEQDAEHDMEHDLAVRELQRLLACYQYASLDDKRVVWAVLNKYAVYVNI